MANESQVFPEETWNELLNLIELRKVVPIVGRALSLVDAGDGKRVPVLDAVVDPLAKRLGIAPRDTPWTLNELFVESARTTVYSAESFHLMLRKELEEAKPALDPLKRLAEIDDFRLFLSTGIDGFLEQAVAEVRRAKGDTVHTIAFAPDGYHDLPGPLEDADGVTVFKLLGARETCPNWVVTVENSLEFVFALQGEKYRPVNLLDAVKDRHLLAIGCKIPDWLGRFFLRSLRGGPISAQRSSNFLVENVGDTDETFSAYLRTFGRRAFVVPGDSAGFVDELHRRWKERKTTQPRVDGPEPGKDEAPPLPPLPPVGTPHKVFLSYSHADRDKAKQLYNFLSTRRIDVWMDDAGGLRAGDIWETEIKRRIDDCACFVPLVTQNTAKTQSYFWVEWNHAKTLTQQMDPDNRRFIFPVLGDDGVPVPDVFKAMQATPLPDDGRMRVLADSLRTEQQRFRKEQRALS
jgi:hypothetical protein